MKNRLSEAQVTAVLMDALAGESAEALGQRHGLSSAAVSDWLAVLHSMKAGEAKRQAAVFAENTRLKKLLAEALFEVEIARKIVRKSGMAQAAADWSAHGPELATAIQYGQASGRAMTVDDIGQCRSSRAQSLPSKAALRA